MYTVNDSHASRTYGVTYAFAAFALAAIARDVVRRRAPRGTGPGRLDAHRLAPPRGERGDDRRRYVMVLIAVRRAPVGYVAALRESSVLVAAFLGTRYLSEGQSRDAPPPVVILTGLVLLVASG